MALAPQNNSKTLFSPVAELDNTRKSWILMLRAVRVYYVPRWAKGGDSMEIVFHDEHGTRIHAHLNRPEKIRFEKQITEGGVFGIRNVFVQDNYQSLKTTSNEKLLGFYKDTEVKTLNRPDFPNVMFDLKPFPIIQSQPCLNDQLLIDVIRKIVARTKVQTNPKKGMEQKLMEVTLEDHDGNRLGCTLWGEYVDRFMDCLTQNNQEPVIMLLSFCRPRRYMGTVTVSTSFHVTKMIFDGNSPEVNEFRARLPQQLEDGHGMGSIVLGAAGDGDEGVIKTTTIKALLDSMKPGPYWIIGEIASLHDSTDWCYLGCTDCNRKVIPDGDKFKCSGCSITIPHGVYRYKVNVRVYDSTGHASFILWDRECTELLGASAFLLREIMFEKEIDPNFLPHELNHLLGQKCLFHIVLKPEVGSPSWTGPRAFGVRSLVTDPKILSKYEHLVVVEDEEADKESQGLWASLEDLSQKVHEVVGSNDPSSSHSVNNKQKRILNLEETETLKRELYEEMSTTECKKLKKETLKD